MRKWILLAEDDTNDADLTLRAFAKLGSAVLVLRVRDGVEALNCLYRRAAFASRDTGPPALLLLDLKMPGADGFAVLRQMKEDSALKNIPVAVFTSSREPDDVRRSYQLGTNAYVVKPVGFREFVEALQEIQRFWLDLNEPAPRGAPQAAAPAAMVLDSN